MAAEYCDVVERGLDLGVDGLLGPETIQIRASIKSRAASSMLRAVPRSYLVCAPRWQRSGPDW